MSVLYKPNKLPSGLYLFQEDISFTVLDAKKSHRRMTLPLLESKGKVTNEDKDWPVLRCTGVFQRSDEKNANGRIYPHSVLTDAVKRLNKVLEERHGIMGEFDHPPDAKIHLDRVSHLITKLYMDGKTVVGELESINDDRCPCGAMLSCYLDRGIQIGISSRGVGDMELVRVQNEDAYKVQPGFELITFDAVAEPSVSGTQLEISEGVARRFTESRIRTPLKSTARSVRPQENLRESYERNLVSEFKKLLSN